MADESEPPAADELLIPAPPSRAQTLEWLAVLGSARVPYELRALEDGWFIVVAQADGERARHQLSAFIDESRTWPPRYHLERGEEAFSAISSVFIAGWLVAFFLHVTGPIQADGFWFVRGGADADLIFSGEFWRVVTAMTLHANLGHVAGNAVGCFLLGSIVCRYLGFGSGWLLLVLSGAGANTVAAALLPGHRAVGASTAVFAAVGVLAAMRMTRMLEPGIFQARDVFLPILAILGMLSMIGISPGADVLGHAAGAGCGLVFGFFCLLLRRWRDSFLIQLGLYLVVLGLVVGAWQLALP